MSTATQLLYTAEEFARRPDPGYPEELVRGRIVSRPPPQPRHGQVCNKVGRIFGNYADEHDLGHVLSNDSGVITERGPDTVRGADVSFYLYSRVPKGPLPAGYLDVPPDLVFEVRSPEERWPKLLGKVVEYLNAGVRVVGVLDPERNTLQLYEDDQPVRILSEHDELTLPGLLEGFRVAVSRFFE
jgi:Uma2 family endonuclease